MRKDKKGNEGILVCENCGSSDVETKAWVKVNENNKYVSDADSGDTSCNWCNTCENHIHLITLEQWEENNEIN